MEISLWDSLLLVSGLNLICLHSQDATMAEEKGREMNWVNYEEGGKHCMYVNPSSKE